MRDEQKSRPRLTTDWRRPWWTWVVSVFATCLLTLPCNQAQHRDIPLHRGEPLLVLWLLHTECPFERCIANCAKNSVRFPSAWWY